MARPFFAPPNIPADRKQALRKAFDDTMKDADFLAEAHTADLDVRPVTGAAVEALIKEIYASPTEAIKMATEALQAKP
jgi:tripartite-type tricarboxylate transporter receptor subunit TctC